MIEVFEGVYHVEDQVVTRNLLRGEKSIGEKIIPLDGDYYRVWEPKKSKLSACIKNGLKTLPIKNGSRVLYLGAGSGTTASYISDIVLDGIVFCIEFSRAPMNKLIPLCKKRMNLIPIFSSADKPLSYAPLLEKVDVIYQDVAQKNQAEILIKNSDVYLKEGGHVLLTIKTRSIDSTLKSEQVVSREIEKLKPYFKVSEVIDLEPYEKGHTMIVGQKK